jgi:hypothetical protein
MDSMVIMTRTEIEIIDDTITIDFQCHRSYLHLMARQLVDIEKGARIIKVAPSTLGASWWRELYRVPCYRVGRRVLFDPAELEAWIQTRRVEYQAR